MCPTPKCYCFHPCTLCKCNANEQTEFTAWPGDWTRKTHLTKLLDVSKNSSSREKLVLELRYLNHTQLRLIFGEKFNCLASLTNNYLTQFLSWLKSRPSLMTFNFQTIMKFPFVFAGGEGWPWERTPPPTTENQVSDPIQSREGQISKRPVIRGEDTGKHTDYATCLIKKGLIVIMTKLQAASRICFPYHWRIQRRGGARDAISFIFMQFSAKLLPNSGLVQPL